MQYTVFEENIYPIMISYVIMNDSLTNVNQGVDCIEIYRYARTLRMGCG